MHVKFFKAMNSFDNGFLFIGWFCFVILSTLFSPEGQYKPGLSNKEVQKKRIYLFDQEVKRQKSLIADIEKIRVNYTGLPEEVNLVMNKYISTPYDCAQRKLYNATSKYVIPAHLKHLI